MWVLDAHSVHKAPCTVHLSGVLPPFSKGKKLRHREVNRSAQRLSGFVPSSAGLFPFHPRCLSGDSGHLLFLASRMLGEQWDFFI